MSVSRASIKVDPLSPMPLYSQVSAQLEDAIASGVLGPGHKLSNEIALADELGISRPTMRRAIQELVNKGLLVRKRGVGTQVVQGRIRREIKLSSLYDDLSRNGQKPSTRVLVNAIEAAPPQAAEELGITPGDPARRLERLRLANGQPLALLRNWLPETLLAPNDQELEQHGLYELIRARGIFMRVARQRLGARPSTPEETQLLLCERNDWPLLTMERTTYDDQGRAVEFGSHAYRCETYSFEMTLVER